ncbi:integrase core domain-containing protein [Mycolicibacterium mucogenicum]|uniref:DDE-type integrase/transposase/recombinase n=1 Tax=Mycolicibacterium mucogenicum TaxID=56689 RepID=UPI00226ACDAA|nr:DDE-type integrase/transposase/recombinase [Mycolicibacterium mucogenicum]MCX8554387.1 integrase core domain-containing protein [Mycolicibacterium mucogenicum]
MPRRRDRRLSTPTSGQDDVADPANQEGRPAQTGFHRRAGQRYVGDITLLAIGDRRQPVPGHRDRLLLQRRVANWAIADHMRTELVIDALGRYHCSSLAGAIFHADHGSQYTSRDFANLCRDLGVVQSMGAVGSSADNALAESFNAALKREILQDRNCWPDAAICRREVFRWLARYNTTRRHSYCRHSSPATYERNLTPATLPEAA